MPLLWYFHTHTSLCLRLSPSHIPPALWIPCAKAAPSLPRSMEDTHTHLGLQPLIPWSPTKWRTPKSLG